MSMDCQNFAPATNTGHSLPITIAESDFGKLNNTATVTPRLELLVDIMPTTRSSRRHGESIIEPAGKKLRSKSPNSTNVRARTRSALSSVSSFILNKPKAKGPENLASPVKTMGDVVPIVLSPNRTRSRSRRKEKVSSMSSRPSVTPTSEPQQDSSPRVGDKFRVLYDKADDCFGTARDGAKGWFHGTVTFVSRPRKADDGAVRFKIKIKFYSDGAAECFEYPSPTVEKMVESCDGPNQLMGENGDFACDLCPAQLDCGDLVLSNYQHRGPMYRGRVASISLDRKYCDVIYDDNELEKGIPLGMGFVWLIEDGRQYRQWLDGLKVKIPLGSSRKAVCTIRVPKEEGSLELVHANGRVEKQGYHRVVRELFDEAKTNCKSTFVWPHVTTVDRTIAGTDSDSVKPEKSKSQHPSATARRNTKASAQMTRQVEYRSASDVDRRVCLPQDFTTDPWQSDNDDDESWEEMSVFKEMSNSARNSFWKALNSSEGHIGGDLFFKASNFHRKIPNDELCKDLVELLWRGPLHRSNQFPDLVRSELASNYFDLLRQKGIAARFAKSLPTSFTQDFLAQIENPAVIYCVAGDESRTTSAALQRVGQTLSVKNSGASMVCYLLQNQLRGYQQFGKKASLLKSSSKLTFKRETDAFLNQLQSRDLTRSILDGPGGTQSLKLAVRASFSILIHFGHYLSSDFVFPPPSDADTQTRGIPGERAFVATEVRRLLKSMGRIVAYLAWLYSIEQGESIYHARFLIRDVVDGLLSSSTFDPSMFLTKREGSNDERRLSRHWKDMKLQFSLSLEKRISGLLGKHTAELFELTLKYF